MPLLTPLQMPRNSISTASGLGGLGARVDSEVECAFHVQDQLDALHQLVSLKASVNSRSEGLPHPLVAVAGGQSAGKSSL